MPEHRIQLRRAWDSKKGGIAARADLPATWSEGEAPDRLARRFQRPSGLGPGDSLALEFDAVEGLRGASLNGVDIGPIPTESMWEAPITDHGARGYQITLDLEPSRVPIATEWGRIALVIRS